MHEVWPDPTTFQLYQCCTFTIKWFITEINYALQIGIIAAGELSFYALLIKWYTKNI